MVDDRDRNDERFKISEGTRDLLEATCDWFFITDDTHVVRDCHRSAKNASSVQSTNLVGHSFAEFLPSSARDRVNAALQPSMLVPGRCVEMILADPLTGPFKLSAMPRYTAEGGFDGCMISIERIDKDTSNIGVMRQSGKVDEAAALRMLSKILIEFAKIEDAMHMMTYAMQMFGEFFGLKHVYGYIYNEEADEYVFAHEWHSSDASKLIDRIEVIKPDIDPMFMSELTTRPYVVINDVNDLDTPIPTIVKSIGIRSMAVIPVYVFGKMWGLLGGDYGAMQHTWSDSEIGIALNIIGVLSSYIERQIMNIKLTEAMEDAKKANRAKSEFLSRMSHEIRTPMNAIIGMNEIARHSHDLDRVRYCLDKLGTAAEQLLGLINDVLDFSKIEADKMEIVCAPFQFEQMLDSIYHVIQSRVDAKEIEFTFDIVGTPERFVISDKMRITQVVTNFLSNAVKFTPEHGHINVRTDFWQNDDDVTMMKISVEDTGIGISKDAQEKIFNSFEQASSDTSHNYGGTGLGLAICKRIAELMNGRVWVESEPGMGSTFSFEIPVDMGELLDGSIKSHKRARNVRILVADSDQGTLVACRHIAETFGMKIDTAPDVASAKQIVERGDKIDAVFWGLPCSDLETESASMFAELTCDHFIIMDHMPDDPIIQDTAQRLGMQRFIRKPLLPSLMLDAILERTGSTIATQHGDADASYYWAEKRILIAEDIEINQEILRSLLEDTEIEIVTANDGEEAVETFKNYGGSFDAVLMDVEMPKLNGYQATAAIRELDKEVPIIAMTANAFNEDIERCLRSGMNDHLAKPIDVAMMMKKLDLYMTKKDSTADVNSRERR